MLIYLPALVIGFLLVHLIWPERSLLIFLFKTILGVGTGLGLTSLLYFIVLVIDPIGFPFLTMQIAILLVLLFVTIRRERFIFQIPRITLPKLTFTKYVLPCLFLLVLLITIVSFINFSIRRDQGGFDAWMIYNRAARFIYRDTANWRATVSPELYSGSHADYPLLLPSNVAWAWASLGAENVRVPLVQSGLYLFGSIGLLFIGVAQVKSFGQASLGTIILMSLSGFIRDGSSQTADIPLAFYILASIVLLYLAIQRNNKSLFALSGFMAGLAGWVKNEGLLLIVISLAVLFFFCVKQKSMPSFLQFATGLLFPALVIAYFKIALAPPSDLFVGDLSKNLAKVIDPTRYYLILKFLFNEILYYGEWPFSLPLSLLVYGFVFGFHFPKDYRKAFGVVIAIIGMQLAGYMGIYLITPYDLKWHLSTSLGRTTLQVFPSLLFLLFASIKDFGNLFESHKIIES